ncbi:14266_t:CDS:2, partial [Racocetra persica]
RIPLGMKDTGVIEVEEIGYSSKLSNSDSLLSNCSFADDIKLVAKEVSKVDEIEIGETE